MGDEDLFGEEHVRAYRETGGERGYHWRRGTTILLLATRGRRTGEDRTTPLIHRTDGPLDSRRLQGRSGRSPRLVQEHRGGPRCRDSGERRADPGRASSAAGEERERLWRQMTEVWPDYDEYQRKTDRQIPVVVLERR